MLVRQKQAAVVVPGDLAAALAKAPGAARAFEALAASHRREYVKWVEEAKKAETRAVRVGKVVARVGGG
jgi:uncharacterized protein YdeI (YjbR/CyaY-like superfamily)